MMRKVFNLWMYSLLLFSLSSNTAYAEGVKSTKILTNNPEIILPIEGVINSQACSGQVFDSGGPNGDYGPLQHGQLNITPPGATSITLTFNEFNLGNEGEHTDMLFVFNPETFEFYDIFFGTELPNNGAPISYEVGALSIAFVSNETLNFSGFAIEWLSNGSTAAPIAAFSTPNQTVPLNTPVFFVDESENGPGIWQWDFGDGNTAAVQNPTHTYSIPGTYEVSLVAENCIGVDTAEVLLITVQDAATLSYSPASYNITVAAGEAISEDLEICNTGLGDLVVTLGGQAQGFGLGYVFEFITNENGADFSWQLLTENFEVIRESTTDFAANQTYVENIFGLEEGLVYYFAFLSPEGVQVLEQFSWIDPQTGEVFFEGLLETGPLPTYVYSFPPPPTSGTENPWLEINTESLVLAPAACTNVPITFDATNLLGGVYEGNISLVTNDPGQSFVEIPIIFTV
ncbi:MAG: PKD domain-containing protein, partial [Bacteroidota bacterium]